MAKQIDTQKAALTSGLSKEVQAAKTIEEKLALLLGALDVVASYELHARALLHEALKEEPEGKSYEINGFPHKRGIVRGTQEEGKEVRYTLRSSIPKAIREMYTFARKDA